MKLRKWTLVTVPMMLIVFGAALNQAAVVANHGQMPVLWPGGCDNFPNTDDTDHVCMTPETRLKFLCDWIELHGAVESPGDVFILLGMVLLHPLFWMWVGLVLRRLDYVE